MKARELVRRLKQAGVEILKGRGKGGHYWARRGDSRTTVPFHGNADIDRDFVKEICKQLGLDPKDILGD